MECLELRIPPLPQLVTIGHATWQAGMQHFRRNFQVFDVLFVRSGCFYITEDGTEYELGPGGLLVLEPGRTHWGHRPVEADTAIDWVHLFHPHPHRAVEAGQIAWSGLLRQGSDQDLMPTDQWMYLPKHGHFELDGLTPLLDEMGAAHRALTVRSASALHVLTGQLLHRMQSLIDVNAGSRSYRLSERAVRYLQEHMLQPFSAARMEEKLHYQFDYLSRCLKQHTGMTPLQYLHRLQMEHARSLLHRTDLTVQEVADRAGQPNVNYFNRLFRKHFGMSPGQYRKSTRGLL